MLDPDVVAVNRQTGSPSQGAYLLAEQINEHGSFTLSDALALGGWQWGEKLVARDGLSEVRCDSF